MDMQKKSGCPFKGMIQFAAGQGPNNRDWWPDQLNLSILKKDLYASPLGKDFNYIEAFNSLDYNQLKKDLYALMTDSKSWWPADYGHYGPFFIRMAWHSAGTYRVTDGRGGSASGNLRFAPLNSWPDNANLDKARRLLWPIKQKYGEAISWADLMILTGNCALESMGFKTYGFAGGREDIWQPEGDVYWGPELEWLGDERYTGDRWLEKPLGAVQMGLIYVNPQGPNGRPDPLAAAHDIRETFKRMAMNDEETVALTAGGHTFGKCHGAAPEDHLGREPEGAPIEAQGLGWHNVFGSGVGNDAITSGIEGAWTTNPIHWDNGYFDALLNQSWTLIKGPGGAYQWQAEGDDQKHWTPDAHDPKVKHPLMMTTADMALREDPDYAVISKRFHENPDLFADAFARAWFKLTHRDMGPKIRYLGPEVPKENLLWQDHIPACDHPCIEAADIARLKQHIIGLDIPKAAFIKAAWGAASTYRDTDKRGGANGGRLRLLPQKDWVVNEPESLDQVLKALTAIQKDFNDEQTNRKQVSMADLIVLAGGVAIEDAAKQAGVDVIVPFNPGRMDASQAQTDIESFELLEPSVDGFRNYRQADLTIDPMAMMIDYAQRLTLSAAEMTVLLGGFRAMGISDKAYGILTHTPGQLTNDFFIHLLDMNTQWVSITVDQWLYEGAERDTKKTKWQATKIDLTFGSNSELRAVAEVYAAEHMLEPFIHAFIAAWSKVMHLDRFDLDKRYRV